MRLLNGFLTQVSIMQDPQEVPEVPNNVLLAEDDPKDRLEVRLHLELMGFIVYDTPTSSEAKEIFVQRDFSLVLIHFSINPSAKFRTLQMDSR